MTTEIMDRKRLLSVMKDGKVCSLTFTKRDGTRRLMPARLGVTAHLHGGEKNYKDEDYNIVTVFDMNGRGYRAVRCDSLIEVKKNGRVIWSSREADPKEPSSVARRSED